MFAKVSTISRISYRKRQNKTKSNDEHEDDVMDLIVKIEIDST